VTTLHQGQQTLLGLRTAGRNPTFSLPEEG
jgi:hypothetical protein